MPPSLSLTVLVDNTSLIDRYFCGEPGLSFLIRTGGKTVLFDTGYSGLFLKNAMLMGIDLLDVDTVVLSHGHLDHAGGLVPFTRHVTWSAIEGKKVRKPMLVAHPHCFYPRPKPPVPDIGAGITEADLAPYFDMKMSPFPRWLTPDLIFLGEIPQRYHFEETDPGKRTVILPDGKTEPDRIPDDSALACRTDEGLVIITGCSHAGICNIVEYAKEACRETRIVDIVGGLHLLSPDRHRLEKTAEYLHDLNLSALHACHCTSLASKLYLAGSCPVQETGVGMTLAWQ